MQAQECPRSFVTGESLALFEEFFVRRRLGMTETMETQARKVDAFLILRQELEQEEKDVSSSQH